MILSLPELNVPLLMHKANKDKKKTITLGTTQIP
jgi:hypothetical protein